MQVFENFPLVEYNTFGIKVLGKFFSKISSVETLRMTLRTLQAKNNSVLILGGGSNILFTRNFDGIILYNEIDFIEITEEDSESIILRAGGGTSWNKLVEFAVDHGWGGIENLVLIPGSCGAAPIQNIGAYGSELKECLVNLEALSLESNEIRIFSPEECRFGYRDSIFKGPLKGKYFITAISVQLRKNPVLVTHYGDVEAELETTGKKRFDVKDVANAVSSIRRSKLPDPAITGNAGSFFKNPVVQSGVYHALKEKYPLIPAYPSGENFFKLPAGWLIEKAGWKGHRRGNCGVHPKQALVLVNYGNAGGDEILSLANDIRKSIANEFGIELETEVTVL